MQALFGAVSIDIDTIGVQIAFQLAMWASFGYVAVQCTRRVISWIAIRFGAYIKRYDVVELPSTGHQYKIAAIRLRGVILENGEGGILVYPLAAWSAAPLIVIKQQAENKPKPRKRAS